MYDKKWLFRHLPFPCNLGSTLVQPMGIQPCPVSSATGWVERTGNNRTKILLFKRYKLLYKSNNFNNFSGSPVFLPPQKPTSPNSNSTGTEDSHEKHWAKAEEASSLNIAFLHGHIKHGKFRSNSILDLLSGRLELTKSFEVQVKQFEMRVDRLRLRGVPL